MGDSHKQRGFCIADQIHYLLKLGTAPGTIEKHAQQEESVY
jgi:hypothetical protein